MLACGTCVSSCPAGNRKDDGEYTRPGALGGTACGDCADVCPTGARAIAGARMTVAELPAEIDRSRVFLDESGGSVTFPAASR